MKYERPQITNLSNVIAITEGDKKDVVVNDSIQPPPQGMNYTLPAYCADE